MSTTADSKQIAPVAAGVLEGTSRFVEEAYQSSGRSIAGELQEDHHLRHRMR